MSGHRNTGRATIGIPTSPDSVHRMPAQPAGLARLGTVLLLGTFLLAGVIALVIAGLLPAQVALYAALVACGLIVLLVVGDVGRPTR